MSSDPTTYTVGYGRPPEATRFKAGQSGNPKGRPKGSHNFQTLLDDEMQARVPVVINGKTVRLSKAELAVRQQVDKAAHGDLRAFALLMKVMGQKAPIPDGGDRGQTTAAETELTANQFADILASIARDHVAEGAS